MAAGDDQYLPPCAQNPDIFFSPKEDGREEVGRFRRELVCKSMCFRCEIRTECLKVAITSGHSDGVWGAMGEGERRQFTKQLRRNGHDIENVSERRLRIELRKFYAARYRAS